MKSKFVCFALIGLVNLFTSPNAYSENNTLVQVMPSPGHYDRYASNIIWGKINEANRCRRLKRFDDERCNRSHESDSAYCDLIALGDPDEAAFCRGSALDRLIACLVDSQDRFDKCMGYEDITY